MTELHEKCGTGPGDAHFAVLTDHADAAAVARSFARPRSRILAHTSGRPSLVGRRHDDEVATATAGGAAVAVLGCCPIDAGELRRRAARLRDLPELDALARSLPGSLHLVGALDGQ